MGEYSYVSVGRIFSPDTSSLVVFIAFAAFFVLTLVREIDLALEHKPRVKVELRSGRDHCLIVVHNSGGKGGDFKARAEFVDDSSPFAEPFDMYWQGHNNARCFINAHGDSATIKVAEKSQTDVYYQERHEFDIRKGHLVGFYWAGTEWQRVPIRTYVRNETTSPDGRQKIRTHEESAGIIQVIISSEPPLLRPFRTRRYRIEMACGEVRITELPKPDK